MNPTKNKKNQYAKIVLIVSCIFAVIASALIIVSICGFPKAIEYKQRAKYLYENGVEVDAYAIGYYDNYSTTVHTDPNHRPHTHRSGRFYVIYKYNDGKRAYQDEYIDTVNCRSRDELRVREQYIKQMIATDGATKKMLIADNGLCCLSIYKESLISNNTLIIYISIIAVSSVVLGLCIFGIVRQSKKLKRHCN